MSCSEQVTYYTLAYAGGEDRVPLSKAGGSGASPGIPRIGYSGQGYHSQPHHGQYKVICDLCSNRSGGKYGLGQSVTCTCVLWVAGFE